MKGLNVMTENMKKKSSGEDWEHLSNSKWNKKLDDKITEFNAGRGEVKLPPPATAVMGEEYARGINNKLVTEDLIRHFADACGDPNPIWRDPTYAAGTRWGGIIAPPMYETCIAFGSAFGGRLRVPGIARLAGGSKHIYYRTIRPGDTFSIYDKYEGFVEKQVTGKNYRMFIESVPRYYVNQRDEVAAVEIHRNIYMATPPGLRGKKKENRMYQDRTRYKCTQEDLEMIHQSYDDTLAGKYRRGADVRYWEDVNVGEETPLLMRGPVDVTDACARTTVSCYSYAYAIKWACMKNHLSTHPIDPETGEYFLRRDWHYRDHAAQVLGYPMANSAGAQNEMMLIQAATDWMGDDAFVKAMDSQDRKMVFFGDITYVKGTVDKKYVDDDGDHVIELNVNGVSQLQEIHTKSTFTIKLVSRTDYNKSL